MVGEMKTVDETWEINRRVIGGCDEPSCCGDGVATYEVIRHGEGFSHTIVDGIFEDDYNVVQLIAAAPKLAAFVQSVIEECTNPQERSSVVLAILLERATRVLNDAGLEPGHYGDGLYAGDKKVNNDE